MNIARAWHLSMGPYPIALAIAVGVGVATYLRDPDTAAARRSTQFYFPAVAEDVRPFVTTSPAAEPALILARLREIRIKFGRLHEAELFEEADEAPGSVAELDRLLMQLISDVRLAETPLVGAKP